MCEAAGVGGVVWVVGDHGWGLHSCNLISLEIMCVKQGVWLPRQQGSNYTYIIIEESNEGAELEKRDTTG